uniref:Uncharacterized protein n=1 Tax=Tanacetum cinerariifolium TaxID=118510 RepID=A0A6L2J6F5_TANCI|nr:hypothetical protein [Tanacetum cinerariifolium]
MQQIQDKVKKSCMYTQLAIPEFRDTLIQHLEYVKKSIDERAQLKREYDSWLNERQTQTTKEKVDMSKALDASSVDTKSSRTESKEQDTNSISGNDAHDNGADIRPIYDEKPMAKNRMDLPKDTPYLEMTVLRYDGDECDKGRMPTKIRLTLEQSQQGVSNDVLVSIEGVEELKRNVWIKGENKKALQYTLGRNRVNTYAIRFTKMNSEHPSDTYVLTVKMELLLEPTSNKLLVGLDDGVADSFQLESDSSPHDHAQTTKTY